MTVSGLHSTLTSAPGVRGRASSTAARPSAGTSDGVPASALSDDDRADLAPFLVDRGDHVVLSEAGRLLANEVAVRLR